MTNPQLVAGTLHFVVLVSATYEHVSDDAEEVFAAEQNFAF